MSTKNKQQTGVLNPLGDFKTPKGEKGIWNDTSYYYEPPVGEINDEASMTVPDQTMSMRELMTRFTNGLPLEGNSGEPLWDEDNDQMGVNPKTLDLVDRQNLQEYANDIFAKAEEKIEPITPSEVVEETKPEAEK